MRVRFTPDPITGEEQQKVGRLDVWYKKADAVRRQYEAEWVANALFLEGKHWDEVPEDLRTYTRRIPVAPKTAKVKLTINWCYTLARQAAAGLRDSIARQVAVPATTDPDDVLAAGVYTDFLDTQMDRDMEAEMRFREIIWTMVTGRVLRKTFWDPDIDGRGEGGRILRGAGDIVTMTLNPFRFHIDPWAEGWNDVRFVIESDVRDIDEVNALFPGHDVQEEEIVSATRMMEKVTSSALGWTNRSVPRKSKACLLKRFYASPTPKFPKGKLFVVAHGKLLYEGDLPEGELPFVPLEWFFIPGRGCPLPFMTPIRDPNREYDITFSQLIELKNRQLAGDMIISGPGKITYETDDVTGARRMRAPEGSNWGFVPHNLNAGEAEKLMALLWNSGMELAGIRESSLGKMPPRETSGALALVMKEADIQGLTVFRRGKDLAHSRIARHKGMLAKRHYKVARMIRVVGQKDALKTYAFFGADLRGTDDVRPKPVPYLTEAQQVQVRQEAMTRGPDGSSLFGPYNGPKDKHAKLKALLNTNLPGIDDEVQDLLGPNMTMKDLELLVAEIDAEEGQLVLAMTKARRIGLIAQIEEEMAGPSEGEPEPAAAGMGA